MPSRQMNAHITYHVAQAKQAKHGSLVDRGAKGGLGGSDVRVWYTNTVDDKSVQVGGKQKIVTFDGYSMPLICKNGLMYL